MASASARERFEREAQLLARLHHSGIVQVFEAGTHQEGPDQVPFIAMEFIPGARPITQFAAAKSLKPRQIVELVIQACAAVQHGNEHGIIHRDLKPSNVLVDQDGNVKVIDFGVARALDSDIADVTMQTHIGQLVGTVHYMSPEQIGGDSRVLDARTDVYSLGVVLYELLSGNLPFDLRGKSLAEATQSVQADSPARLSSIVQHIDLSLETIVNKATARDRADRYASVRDLADDLSRWTRGEEIAAKPAGLAERAVRIARHWSGHNRFAAWILIALVATSLGWGSARLLVNHVRPFAPIAIVLQKTNSPPPIEHFQQVKAIVINRANGEITAEADAAIAGIEGVANKDVRSWRLLHAQLMKRIATAGARSLVFDIHFPESDARSDDAMFAGIAACEQASLPLVLFRPFWPANPDVPVLPTDRILADPRVVIGVGAAPESGDAIEQVPFANQRGQKDPWPGLALAAWASAELGRVPILYSYDREHVCVIATSRQLTSAGIGQVDRQITFPVYSIQPATASNFKSKTQVGDMLALASFGTPTSQALEDATLSTSDVFAMNDSQLRAAFRDKIVIVADVASDSKAKLRGGEVQPGYAVHMAAIEAISSGLRPRLVSEFFLDILFAATAAFGGLTSVSVLRKLRATKPGWVLLLMTISATTVLIFAFSYFLPSVCGFIAHPLAPSLAAAISAILSWSLFRIGDQE